MCSMLFLLDYKIRNSSGLFDQKEKEIGNALYGLQGMSSKSFVSDLSCLWLRSSDRYRIDAKLDAVQCTEEIQ